MAGHFKKETLLFHCKLLEDALFAMQKTNAVKRIVAEMTLVRMCDEALDTSTEALISRIALLEEQVATGALSGPKEQTKSVPEAEASEKAAPVPKRSPQELAPKASKQTEKAADTTGVEKRVLRPLKNWMEVVERINRSAPMTASFVKSSRAYMTDDGNVIVRFENEFGKLMLDQPEAKDRLRAALSAVLKREVDKVTLEVVGKTAKASVIDEILEASDEE